MQEGTRDPSPRQVPPFPGGRRSFLSVLTTFSSSYRFRPFLCPNCRNFMVRTDKKAGRVVKSDNKAGPADGLAITHRDRTYLRGQRRVPVRVCRARLAAATVIQSSAPSSTGLGPALRSAGTLVDRPIAERATATKNTDRCCSEPWLADGITPAELSPAATTKPIRNHGTRRTTRSGDIRAGTRAKAEAAVPPTAPAPM